MRIQVRSYGACPVNVVHVCKEAFVSHILFAKAFMPANVCLIFQELVEELAQPQYYLIFSEPVRQRGGGTVRHLDTEAVGH
jgi:hypothetical protein